MDAQFFLVWLQQPDGAWRETKIQREHYARVVAIASGPNGDPTISLVEPRRKALAMNYYAGPERRGAHGARERLAA